MGIRRILSRFSIPRLRRTDGAQNDGWGDHLPLPEPRTDGVTPEAIRRLTTSDESAGATRPRYAIPRTVDPGFTPRSTVGAPALSAPTTPPFVAPSVRGRYAIPRTDQTVYGESTAVDPVEVTTERTPYQYRPDELPTYEPSRGTEGRFRITQPETVNEIASRPVVNTNSRGRSALLTAWNFFKNSLLSGASPIQAATTGVIGGVTGAIDPTQDEKFDRQRFVAKQRGILAQNQATEDASLKRLKTQAETADILGRPARARQAQENVERDDLIKAISLRKYYKRGEDPALDREVDRVHANVVDFDNRKDGKETVPVKGPDGRTYNVTPGVALAQANRAQAASEKVDYTLSDGRTIKVSTATAAAADATRENREQERARTMNEDDRKRAASEQEARLWENEEQLYYRQAETAHQAAEDARARGDEDEYYFNLGEERRLKEEARRARAKVVESRSKGAAQPTFRYRGRSGRSNRGGNSQYNVDLNKYGLNP